MQDVNHVSPDLLGDRARSVALTPPEIQRYARHLIMPEVAMEGQKRLKAAKVLCIGTGGLGSPLSLYLAAAGVGTLGLVDFDVVDVSNLQRQIIHFTDDVGRPKIASAEEKLKAINPELKIIRHEHAVDSSNALEMFAGYDVIVDGTDNFPTRYLVNDACVLLGKPNVYGSIFRFDGQATVFSPPDGPCYRCLYPEPPPPDLVPNCAEGGVLGILPGLIGVVQATETVKLILGIGKTADRPALALRRSRDDLPRNEGPQEPQVPHLRSQPDDPRADRLSGILRRRAARSTPAAANGHPGGDHADGAYRHLLRDKQAAAHPRRPQPRGNRDLPDRRLDGDSLARAAQIASASWTLPPRSSSTARAESAAPRRSLCFRPPGSPAEEPERRNPRVDQGSRSQPAELLIRAVRRGSAQTGFTSLVRSSRSVPAVVPDQIPDVLRLFDPEQVGLGQGLFGRNQDHGADVEPGARSGSVVTKRSLTRTSSTWSTRR